MHKATAIVLATFLLPVAGSASDERAWLTFTTPAQAEGNLTASGEWIAIFFDQGIEAAFEAKVPGGAPIVNSSFTDVDVISTGGEINEDAFSSEKNDPGLLTDARFAFGKSLSSLVIHAKHLTLNTSSASGSLEAIGADENLRAFAPPISPT